MLADAPGGALRVVVCHHHLAGAPWRASRKFPLKHRDATLRSLAAAGAELVLGGHIHQGTAVERHAFEALDDGVQGSLVLSTAPGFGRPRPNRLGEANGLHVVRWTPAEIRDRDADLAGRHVRAPASSAHADVSPHTVALAPIEQGYAVCIKSCRTTQLGSPVRGIVTMLDPCHDEGPS